MQPASWRNGLLLLACAALFACSGHSRSNNAEALAALKSLRDQGVLSQAEYDAKVAALNGGDAGGLGAGSGLDPGAVAGAGSDGPGAPDPYGGLAAGGNDFAGAASTSRDIAAPVQHHAVRSRAIAAGATSAATAEPATPAAGAHASAMRNLLAQAKAREAAVARSAHELALRMLQRSAQSGAPVPQAPNAHDAAALRS
jgi:hypothetical protein